LFDIIIHNGLIQPLLHLRLLQFMQMRNYFSKELHLKQLNPNEPLLNRKQAAAYLNIAEGTLAVWDCTKRHDLQPIKIGSRVRYRRSSLDQFIETQIHGK
jgi:predicted DNA-binding transcriptional regulator AlpA